MTNPAVTSGNVGSRRYSAKLAAREATVAAMKAPVAVMMSQRALATKNTTKGPTSISSLRNGLGAARAAGSVAMGSP